MKKRMLRNLIPLLGILALIFDSRTALSGAQSGIFLCIQSVIPSIFPFLVLSGMLTSAMMGTNLRFLRPLGRLLGIPIGAECIYLVGILGGYPTGALTVHTAWERGYVNKKDAERMLAFCNNAGPSFLFGILASRFPEFWMPWLLWGIHILSSILVGVILPGKSRSEQKITPVSQISLNVSLKRAVVTMGYICGWVILFRCILEFLDRWVLWLVPTPVRIGVYGILELANGCCNLQQIQYLGTRFMMSSIILSFGGLCVYMQTASVTGKLGLGQYLTGKLLQGMFSLIFSWILQWLLFPSGEKVEISVIYLPVLMLIAFVFVMFMRKKKNRASIPQMVGV